MEQNIWIDLATFVRDNFSLDFILSNRYMGWNEDLINYRTDITKEHIIRYSDFPWDWEIISGCSSIDKNFLNIIKTNCNRNKIDIIQLIHEKKELEEHRYERYPRCGDAAVLLACKEGYHDIAQYLIEDMNVPITEEMIKTSIRHGNRWIAEYLIDKYDNASEYTWEDLANFAKWHKENDIAVYLNRKNRGYYY